MLFRPEAASVPGLMTERRAQAARSKTKAALASQAALEKHAEDVLLLDLRSLSTVTDFFVIATAGSQPQFAAIQDHIEATLRQHGYRVLHTEGMGPAPRPGHAAPMQWMLIDCGDVVVHLLDQSAREFYRLEELWGDAPRIAVTD